MSVTPVVQPPHPTLDRYYAGDRDRPRFVNRLFDEGAPHYEWVCSVMSLGTGEQYRKDALRAAGVGPGTRVLDVATGTGLVLRPAIALSGGRGVIGLDPSAGMLAECRRRAAAPLVQGLGETLPFRDGSFDVVSMGYALRHVYDLRVLFAEYLRVLRPGGRIVVLEISQPDSRIGRQLNKLMLGTLVPGVARLWKGAPAAVMMRYFWDTIEHCVPPATILAALRDAGFAEAARQVTGGVLSRYHAIRPR